MKITLAAFAACVWLTGGALEAPGNGGSVLRAPKPPPSAFAVPGTVTDLRAVAATDTSVVLSWTEVNSGNTAVARYAVRGDTTPFFRFAAAPDVCTTPVFGSTAAGGKTRSCVVYGLKKTTEYAFQLVAFTGTYGTATNFGGFSNIAIARTADRFGPMIVNRPPMFKDTVSISAASLFFDFGETRFPLHGRFPIGDRIATFYDSLGSVTAQAYVLVVRP